MCTRRHRSRAAEAAEFGIVLRRQTAARGVEDVDVELTVRCCWTQCLLQVLA